MHRNQKPIRLLELILRASSDEGDVVWEPFGGLCSTAVAAYRLNRRCFSSEHVADYVEAAKRRLEAAVRAARSIRKTRAATGRNGCNERPLPALRLATA